MMAIPRIPGYELLACLGGGMITSVYSARRLSDDTSCAVKVLRPDWAEEPTAIKLLQREARACLAVSHPHLVSLKDAHVTKPPYFIVMDLLGGESLRRRLRRDYQLNAATVVWIARQTAEALAVLHRAGFVHGDLKPDNIRMIDSGSAMLLDLGFAHRPGENAALLEQGYILGTVDYLAPELCGPQPEDGLAGDLFSLGVTMYEMLSGQLPYRRGSVTQTVRRHESDPPQSIRKLELPLPEGLMELLDGLLARRPQSRPKAGSVVQQLIQLEIASLRWKRAA